MGVSEGSSFWREIHAADGVFLGREKIGKGRIFFKKDATQEVTSLDEVTMRKFVKNLFPLFLRSDDLGVAKNGEVLT